MTKPSKLIVFQKTGFPLFIYDIRQNIEVDINDPDTFLVTSQLSLKLSGKVEKGKTYSVKRQDKEHFLSLLNGAFIDLISPLEEGSQNNKKESTKLLKRIKKRIQKIHKEIEIEEKDLALISASFYEEKVSSRLSSFLEGLDISNS